jgi:hypothetical protein
VYFTELSRPEDVGKVGMCEFGTGLLPIPLIEEEKGRRTRL